MEYRKFNDQGEELSILGFGCMRFPVIDKNPENIDEEKAVAMLKHAIDSGVNYLDTAYPYHTSDFSKPGVSEIFVGKVLKDGYRKKVKLATKLPSWHIQSRDDMDKYLNEQLERLQTDYIDYYLLHALNDELWETLKKHDVFDFIEKALADGRIRNIGFSFHGDLKTFKEIIDSYKWQFCQIQYNYLDENFQAGREGLDYAADRGVGIVVMEPLRGGALAGGIPEDIQDLFKNTDVERTPAEWALRWLWNDPRIAVVLSGMSNMSQVEENIKIASEGRNEFLNHDEEALMEEVKNRFKDRIKVNCTSCKYCMPCPHGVNIPVCFTLYNDYNMLGDLKTVRFRYGFYLGEDGKASKCVECGKCESLCPQSIKIIEELKNVVNLIENTENK